jgi:chemotaxis protein CheD
MNTATPLASAATLLKREVFMDHRLGVMVWPVGPGEQHISADDSLMIATTLGSCIAVCLRDPQRGMGGLNHFMLPATTDGGTTLQLSNAALYGDTAMEMLINALMRAGCDRRRLEAKVFGGARILAAQHSGVGERNIAFATRFLLREGIPIRSMDTGGQTPRRVLFQPATGKALVQHIDPVATDAIARRETRHEASISLRRPQSSVEFF